jgi:holo-[acyl-carrier protein] synthase
MMNKAYILGIGNDILEIERIRQSIESHGEHFLSRLFTPQEQEYCLKYADAAPHFAGRFSGKEAIAKALGTGFGKHTSWLDIEILNDVLGKPVVHLSSTLKDKCTATTFLLSISHSQLYVTAVALWIKNEV